MSRTSLDCWKCGASLSALSLPLSRTDECPRCRTELHVCRMCRFYDVTKANQCTEPVAEPVGNKERANFCGYLQVTGDRYKPRDGASDQARVALESLFGPKK